MAIGGHDVEGGQARYHDDPIPYTAVVPAAARR